MGIVNVLHFVVTVLSYVTVAALSIVLYNWMLPLCWPIDTHRRSINIGRRAAWTAMVTAIVQVVILLVINVWLPSLN